MKFHIQNMSLKDLFNGKNIQNLDNETYKRLSYRSDNITIFFDIYKTYYNFYDSILEKPKYSKDVYYEFQKPFNILKKDYNDIIGINSPSTDYHECLNIGHNCKECKNKITISYLKYDVFSSFGSVEQKQNKLLIKNDVNIFIEILVDNDNFKEIKSLIEQFYY